MTNKLLFAMIIMIIMLSSCTLFQKDSGSLVVQADEGTIIYLNDKAIGTVNSSGQIIIPNITEEMVTLRATHPDKEDVLKTVSIKPKETVDVNFGLEISEVYNTLEYLQHIYFQIYTDADQVYPLRSAEIIVWNDNGIRLNGITDDSGSYIARIDEGRWYYEVNSEFYESINNQVNVKSGEQYVEKLSMKSKGNGTIRLNVEAGVLSSSRIPHVSFKLSNNFGKIVILTADSQGTAIVDLEPGAWYLELMSQGFEMDVQTKYLQVYPGKTETYRIGLIPVSGIPVELDIRSGLMSGNRIDGARIVLRNSHDVVIELFTSSSSPLLVHLTPGNWAYIITASGYEERRGTLAISMDSGSSSFGLSLDRTTPTTGTLNVQVKSGSHITGTNIQGAQVKIVEPSGRTTFHTTDYNGRITYTGEIGTWNIEISAKDHDTRQVTQVTSEWPGDFTIGLTKTQTQPSEVLLTLDKEIIDVHEPVSYSCIASGGQSPLSMTVNFGDGTTLNSNGDLHSYSSPGVYNINCIVTDSSGKTSTSSKAISVRPISSTPSCTIAGNIYCLGFGIFKATEGVRFDVWLQNKNNQTIVVEEIKYIAPNNNACIWNMISPKINAVEGIEKYGPSSVCIMSNPEELNTYELDVIYRYYNDGSNTSYTINGIIIAKV